MFIFSIILITSACRQRQGMNKSRAEKALRVFDSELIGTAAGIMQTDGWDVFSGLLRSDNVPGSGNIPVWDSLPVDLSPAHSILPVVLRKIPINFNREYFKNGKKVCAVNSYFKTNPDSSFYIRMVIFIKPCSLEIKCLCIPDKLHGSKRINIIVSGQDTVENFLDGRMRLIVLTGEKGSLHAETLNADVKLFDLYFSVNADYSQMKHGSRDIWSDLIRKSIIEISDNTSGQYIGCLEFAEKDKKKDKEFLFVFSDGSREPVSAYFSFCSMLRSKD